MMDGIYKHTIHDTRNELERVSSDPAVIYNRITQEQATQNVSTNSDAILQIRGTFDTPEDVHSHPNLRVQNA